MPKQTRKQSFKNELAIPTNSTKLRPIVPCYCKKCNGDWVESRTRNAHEAKECWLQKSIDQLKQDRKKKGKPYQSHNSRNSRSDDAIRSQPIEINSLQQSHQ